MSDNCSFWASLKFHTMFQEDISSRSYPDIVTASYDNLQSPPLQTSIIREDKKDKKTQYAAICEMSRDM